MKPSNNQIILIANQKGGTGKSTVAPLMAGLFVSEHKLNILVIDTHHQQSIFSKRERETRDDPDQPLPYPILYCESKHIIECLTNLKQEYDIILIDWSGRVNVDQYLNHLLFASHMVLVPMVAGDLNLWSTLKFIDYVKNVQNKKKEINHNSELFGFLNMYDNRLLHHKKIRSVAKLNAIPLLRSSLRYSIEYPRLWSTITPITMTKSKIAKFEMLRLTEEVISII